MVKWMKISGIIGMIFTFLFFVYSIFLIFVMKGFLNFTTLLGLISKTGISDGLGTGFIIFSYIFSGIGVILSLIFIYGFFKMGKYTKSKLLEISAKIMIILYLLIIFLIILISLKILALPLLILCILIIFLWIIFIVLFFIGLIEVQDKVKYSRLSGILSLIFFSLLPILYMGSIMGGIFVTMQTIASASLPSSGMITIIILIIFGIEIIYSAIVLILMSLSLLDASKKFENIPSNKIY